MNSAGKPHRNANVSVSSVLRRSPVFRISKPFLSKFITASRKFVAQGCGTGTKALAVHTPGHFSPGGAASVPETAKLAP
jgi:hypothetical protein